jgi:hypothetical protein
MMALHTGLQWLAQHPLGAATALYVVGVLIVMMHAYFERREPG